MTVRVFLTITNEPNARFALANEKQLNATIPGAATTVGPIVTALSTDVAQAVWSTAFGDPGLVTWGGTSWPWSLDVASTGPDITYKLSTNRVSSGTTSVVDAGVTTASLSGTGIKTGTLTWNPDDSGIGATGDRLELILLGSNANMMTDESLTVNVNDVDSWVDAPWSSGPTNQTVSPTAIASSGAFGTATVSLMLQFVSPSGIASGEALGTAKLNLNVVATGIASGEAFGTAKVNLTVVPPGVSSAEAFGTATVSPGPVSVSPTGVSSGEAFGTAVVSISGGPQTVSPSGIAGAEAFGAATVIPNQTVSPTAIGSGQAIGAATVTPGPVTVSPTGITSANAFGTASVVTAGGPQTLTCTGIPSAEVVGTPTLSVSQVLQPVGIGTAELFGAPAVRRVVYIVSPPSVARYPAAVVDMFGRDNPLHQRMSIPVGLTVYLKDGVYHQGRNLPDDLVADAIYRGGSEYEVSPSLVPELTAQGFTIRTETR